ncbi:MAG: metallophosphoesterase family protein [Candidatus Omnitrophica bacterium]|nr:metallophosphoesterase family protein [Candidatus Omnitrophota bacterium]
MRIGVLSDTHIPLNAQRVPKEVLQGLKGVDLILHAGDLINLSVLDDLKRVAEVRAVCGNMDPLEVREALKRKEIIKIGSVKIGLMHGIGSPEGLKDRIVKEFEGDGVNAIVFGHSHSPVNEKKNKILLFNPGSSTDKIFAPYNSYGILTINGKNIEGEIKVIK